MAAEILVLGAGFAGLAAAGELARRRRTGVSIRLVDRRTHSVFSPLLPDIISHRVGWERMLYPLAPHCERLGIEFTQARVERIAPGELRVDTDVGSFPADAIIICLGCETNYFGDCAAQAHAIGLKSTEDGVRIRAGIVDRAHAGGVADGSGAHVIVVGGGYTGFEVATHAAHLVRRLAGRPRGGGVGSAAAVTILDRSTEPLQNCPPRVRRWAVDLIRQLGVHLRTGCTVESFGADDVVLSDGSRLENPLTVWTAGVAPGAACASIETQKTAGGRLAVDAFLRLPGRSTVFAAGDAAGPVAPAGAAPLRMAVQFSLAGGRCAAGNALRVLESRSLRRFRPLDLGYVVPLAPGRGAGVVLGREVVGPLPGILHYAMCAVRSWSWPHRLGVLRDLLRKGSRR